MRLHTHYRNLKISEHASLDEIRQAYRRLSKKYHPDYNPDNPDALRIMQLINEAYRVLSHPELKAEHDLWIANQRHSMLSNPLSQRTAATHPPDVAYPQRFWLIFAIGALAGLLIVQAIWWTYLTHRPAPATATYQRPSTDPKGNAWPLYASYLAGYPQLAKNGNAIASLDNLGDERMIELQMQQQQQWQTIRSFYMPTKSHFTLFELGAGNYRLHIRNLATGSEYTTEPWQLEKATNGTTYNDINITLPETSTQPQ